MIDYPSVYNKENYLKWHEENLQEDALEDKIEMLRKQLKKDHVADLEFLGNLFYTVLNTCKREYLTQHKVNPEYINPIKDALKENSPSYELLFKSTDSIINKLWRKNKKQINIKFSNIKDNLKDLVRTEIICSSLPFCRFVAERLTLQNINVPEDYPLFKEIQNKIESLVFEPEMKMDSGYFAYHGEVKFKNGLIVEIQIHSSLTANWRKISHKLYEKLRLKPMENVDFGTSETRLISLGHLLHLAECELMRLEDEIK